MSDSLFPELPTSRFLLRRIVPSDHQIIFSGLSDPRVIVNYGVSYQSLEATQVQLDWYESLLIEKKGIWWGICDPTMREALLGTCGLNDIDLQHKNAELGYWLLSEYWGKGIARECVSKVLSYAFDAHGFTALVQASILKTSRAPLFLNRWVFNSKVYQGTASSRMGCF